MGRGRRHVDRVRAELHDAFAETYTPRQLAGSFALGTFITMLPTFGAGLLLFVVIVAVTDWVSKLALFASVVVFNPLVKWGVYAASFTLGVLLLGPVEGSAVADISLSAGPAIVARLLVGNLLLAVVATVVSYLAIYQLAVRYEAIEIVETVEELLEESPDDETES